MAVPQNHLPYQMPLGELVKSHEFAQDLLKIRFYCGTAIAVPYGFYRPNTPDSTFDYDTAAGPHPSPKGKALGAT